MVGENRPGDELETDAYEDEPPRSIFSAVWFRVVIVVVVLGVVAAVAVPYVLDWVSPTPGKAPSARLAPPNPRATPPAAPVPPPAPGPGPAPTSPAPPPPAARPTPTPPAPEKTLAAKPAPPKAEPPAAVPAPKPVAPAAKPPATTPPAAKAPAAKAPSPAPARRVAKAAPKAAATKVAAGKGTYWVQVGAFRDPAAATRLTERLRAQKYTVGEPVAGAAPAPQPGAARPAPTGGDLYDIFVTGGSAADINTKLAAKGLAAEAAAGGAVIKPSLPLRDAVALSKDLAAEGLKVQVKRAGAAAPGPVAPAAAAPAAAADGLHRVRVGPYPDRATATAALRELQAAGLTPYIVREGR